MAGSSRALRRQRPSVGSHSGSPGVPWAAGCRSPTQGFPRVPVSLDGSTWPIAWRAERGGGRAGVRRPAGEPPAGPPGRGCSGFNLTQKIDLNTEISIPCPRKADGKRAVNASLSTSGGGWRATGSTRSPAPAGLGRMRSSSGPRRAARVSSRASPRGRMTGTRRVPDGHVHSRAWRWTHREDSPGAAPPCGGRSGWGSEPGPAGRGDFVHSAVGRPHQSFAFTTSVCPAPTVRQALFLRCSVEPR